MSRLFTYFLCIFHTLTVAQSSCDYPVVNIQIDTNFVLSEPTIIDFSGDIVDFEFVPAKEHWQLKVLDSCSVMSTSSYIGVNRQVSEADKLKGICFCDHCTSNSLTFSNSPLSYLIIPESSIEMKVQVTKPIDLIPKKWYQKPLKKGQEIPLEEIFFVAGTDKLLRSSFDELEQLLQVLKKHPNLKIEIQGHVNGPSSRNKKEFQELSEKRAKAVMDWLIEKGVQADRLTSNGYGNTKMIYPEAVTEDEMAANRRVRILIREI